MVGYLEKGSCDQERTEGDWRFGSNSGNRLTYMRKVEFLRKSYRWRKRHNLKLRIASNSELISIQREKDVHLRSELQDLGFRLVSIRYDRPLLEQAREYPDVFAETS